MREGIVGYSVALVPPLTLAVAAWAARAAGRAAGRGAGRGAGRAVAVGDGREREVSSHE